MIDLKSFTGVMDTDSPNENIGQGSVKMARNIRYRGSKGNYRAENCPGNTLIPVNLPAGINRTIGAFYDNLRQRIFYFLYNSGAIHSIRYLEMDTLTIVNLLVCGTNTNGDILGFTLDGKIYNVKILYGDDEQGDTIYFNNSQDEPCQLNIERTLAGTYGTMERAFLEVIKYPANRPPYVTYGDDNTITVNTFRKKLFRFMTRPVYYSREKSVVSMKSEIPLPINAADVSIDQDPTKNSKISIVYETLGADVEAIEILGEVSGKTDENGIADPNSFSDPFLIQTINKADAGLGNNDIATFVFKNDQAYTEIDPEDAQQLQDLVPLEANALEILNGNTPVYGGITEGFNNITIAGSVSSSSIPQKDTQLPYIFVGSQSGDSAFGTGNIHLVVIGTIAVGYTFQFITTNQTITFVATVATTANVIAGLSAAAVVAGFTVVSSDTENLVITKTGESLQTVVRQSPILSITNEFAYNWNDKEAYALAYFDKGGRTLGAQTTQGLSFQTVNYTETATIPNIPQLVLSITNRPPIDAYYFSLLRTKSLAKLKFLYWISDSTYKDSEFAWVGIENLNTFIKKNQSDPNKPSNSSHLAYDFTPGDRIRFIKVLSGSVNTVYVNQDFTIIGQTLSPIINGIQRIGQFIKIALPTTSATFDFGTTAFSNYEVELYTPAQSVANSLNKYYEFGERYTIGNPTLATRYHQGMTQNQTSNLSQPATFTFNKGDVYFRDRIINVGAEYNYVAYTNEEGTGRTTLGVAFQNQSYSDPNITPGSSPSQGLSGFDITTNTTRALLNITSGGPYQFRCKGSINVNFNDFGEEFSYYLQDSESNKTFLVSSQYITQGPHIFNFDVTFQMNSNTRLFIFAYSEGNFHNSKTYTDSDIKITRERIFTVPVMDANYSDYFASKVNSDGRPFIEQPESTQSFNPTLMRWGKQNILNSNINETSRFTALNFDEIDGTKGAIQLFLVRNRQLEILQERGCGWFGIYSKVIQSNAGADVLTTTNDILTRNNIQYLQGDFGISANTKGSATPSKNGYYFTDCVMGCDVRRSADGLINLNEKYFGQYYLKNIITKYNDDYVRADGSIAKLLGYYDYFEEEFVVIAPSGTFDGNTIPNNIFSFNETRNAFNDFKDFDPDWVVSAQDKIFSFKNGQIYIHNNTTNYGEFFGVKTYPSVTLVFNDKEQVKKLFNAIAYQSNQIWVSPTNGDINTSFVNPDTGLRQISSLIEQDYEVHENVRYAALWRDANSMSDAREALLEGDFLEGNWLEITLTYLGSEQAFLYSPYLNTELNPRNF